MIPAAAALGFGVLALYRRRPFIGATFVGLAFWLAVAWWVLG